MKDDRDPLDPLLERWGHVVPDLPQSVAPEVWRRIAYEEAPEARPAWWWQFRIALVRPAVAVAFVAGCVVLGLFLAEIRLSHAHAERSAQIERGYLELIDPMLQSDGAVAQVENASLQP